VFSGAAAVPDERYPLEVVATDGAGNSSTTSVTVAVKRDVAPRVGVIDVARDLYFPRDDVVLAVQGIDDVGVASMTVSYFVDAAGSPASQETFTPSPAAANVTHTFHLDLAALALTNAPHAIRAEVVVRDTRGQSSTDAAPVTTQAIAVAADSNAPHAAITSPIAGTELYSGTTATFEWRANDESPLEHVEVSDGTRVVFTQDLTLREASGAFGLPVPSGATELRLSLTARDSFGQERTTEWVYPVSVDAGPEVTITSPPAGQRLAEGETFTATAQISDDRAVTGVRFFVERGGVPIDEFAFTGATVAGGMAAGGRFSHSIRVPRKSEGPEDPVRIGVRATDSGGSETEALVELTILEDLEPPRITLNEPSGPQELRVGDPLRIVGEASDDRYVDALTAVFVASDGTRTEVPWASLRREDRVETTSVPSPGGFGSEVTAQRFATTFTGTLEMPTAFAVGGTYDLVIEVRDRGVNSAESSPVAVTVVGDEVSPTISFVQPGPMVVERQDLLARVRFSDDIELAHVRVFLQGDAVDLVDQAVTGSDSAAPTFTLPIGAYNATDPAANEFVLVAEATDAAGNDARSSTSVRIVSDDAPEVRLVDPVPETEVARGGLAFHGLRVTDDFIGPADPLRYFSVYTSLDGIADSATRSATGEGVDTASGVVPVLTAGYPEAGGAVSQLFVHGHVYLETTGDGNLRVHPVSTSSDGTSLRFAVPTGYTVAYDVTQRRTCAGCGCSDSVSTSTVTDAAGVDLAPLEADERLVYADVAIRVLDGSGVEVDWYLQSLRLYFHALDRPTTYEAVDGTRSLGLPELQIAALVRDDARSGLSVVGAHAVREVSGGSEHSSFYAVPVPGNYDVQELSVLAVAVDRFSPERPPRALDVLSQRIVQAEGSAPRVDVVSPEGGTEVVPGQRLLLDVRVIEDTGALDTLSLVGDDGTVLDVTHPGFTVGQHTFVYDVPAAFTGGQLRLSVVARNFAGASGSTTVAYPIHPNAPPQLSFESFASGPLGAADSIITSPTRLDRSEFWARQGAELRLAVDASDDAALAGVQVFQLDALGTRVGGAIFTRDFLTPCPEANRRRALITAQFVFDRLDATQYEAVVSDSLGQETGRRFLVHPVANLAPELRITTPSDAALVAAGTFHIQVGVVATDDASFSSSDITIYANGVRLEPIAGVGTFASPDAAAVTQALGEIHDALEAKYDPDVAARLSAPDYEHLTRFVLPYAMPSDLVTGSEEITLVAVVEDAEGVIGRDEVHFFSAPDDINPEVAFLEPALGFAPHENTTFPVRFRGYDNVKVERMELSRTFAIRSPDGSYVQQAYGAPIRTVAAIESADFEPLSTINIDTPEYTQNVPVPRLAELAALFPTIPVETGTRFDVWLRLTAVDASGNRRERQVSFPIRVDERPVIDVVSPLPGATTVEGSGLSVLVHAFDDVAVDNVRLVATHGVSGTEIANLTLRTAPYQFRLDVPAFDAAAPENNIVVVSVEAVDSYGVVTGDLDAHRALETVSVEIVRDEAPTVRIGRPANDSFITEGEYLLVQANAIDDVGINRVALNVAGLITGDRTFVDTTYPFEFLVPVPYGQAGADLSLTAGATESSGLGDGRTSMTSSAVVVHVELDDQAPTLTVLAPAATGATAVEQRELRFAAEVLDNVRVSTFQAVLYVDANEDGNFTPDEEVARRFLTEPPYAGTFRVDTFENYLGAENTSSTAAMRVEMSARDGAGNTVTARRPVTLVRNQPPEVTDMQVLDSRGFNLGSSVAEITEGRGIVVNVVARDLEVGVDAVRLFIALGDDVPIDSFTLQGEDVAAPFQFHYTVPAGRVGEALRFWAEATDVDGKVSAPSIVKRLMITADQPPTASIILPAATESALIEGEDLRIVVDARDDLGAEGIDRVVFYLAGTPIYTAYDPASVTSGLATQESWYEADIFPPDGVGGFEIYAVAYDRLGQSGRSQTITVGTVEDTVVPDSGSLPCRRGDPDLRRGRHLAHRCTGRGCARRARRVFAPRSRVPGRQHWGVGATRCDRRAGARVGRRRE